MSTTPSVEEVLAEAAKEVEAAGKTPKERKPKADTKPRTPKEPKAPKVRLFKQWNEDGTPQLDAEGNQVMGETKMLKPKVPKQPKLDADGNPIARTHTPKIDERGVISGAPTSCREGSNRAERNKAFEGATTVGDFYAKGGLTKDLLRNMKAGAIKVTLDGVELSA